MRDLERILALHAVAGRPRYTAMHDAALVVRCVVCEQELVFDRPTAVDLEIRLAVHAEDCPRKGE